MLDVNIFNMKSQFFQKSMLKKLQLEINWNVAFLPRLTISLELKPSHGKENQHSQKSKPIQRSMSSKSSKQASKQVNKSEQNKQASNQPSKRACKANQSKAKHSEQAK